MAQGTVAYVTFREIAKDCALHPEETPRSESDYLKRLLGMVWRNSFLISGKSTVYLDYDTTQPDYDRVDRLFLRRIIGSWPREKRLFASLHGAEEMTSDDWNKLAAVPIENIPAAIRESIIERLAFRMDELREWLINHDSIDWLTRWWHRNAESYGSSRSLRMNVEARCVELIQAWAQKLPGTPMKQDLAARARSIIGTGFSHRAFDRAWKRAAPQDWKRPGRRSSLSPHVN